MILRQPSLDVDVAEQQPCPLVRASYGDTPHPDTGVSHAKAGRASDLLNSLLTYNGGALEKARTVNPAPRP